jgi:GYF domain 2
MKKYFLHNGTEQQGPFDIEDLKTKHITKGTSIWHEGLSEWTTADNIEDLKGLFIQSTPPPFVPKAIVPPPIQQTITSNYSTEKKSKSIRAIYIIVGLIALVCGGLVIANNKNSSNGGSYGLGSTYQEKVMTVEETERSQPTIFLIVDGNFNENFWGNKLKVHGVIKNTATVATFKDAVVKVTYYSKTKTALGSKDYTIYDNFPPHSEIKFELKIENYKDVNSIGLSVLQATPN